VKKLFLIPLLVLVVVVFVLAGCSSTTTPATTNTTTTPPATTSTTTTAPATTSTTTTTPATTTAPATKTLTYGVVTDLTNSLGLQNQSWFELAAKIINDKGGLKVGNDTYMLKCIVYSSDGDTNKGVAANNRLIYQDNVKFIINHQPAADVTLPITDPQKVINFCNSAIWNSGLLDKWHYGFTLEGQGTHEVAVAGWMSENNPEMKGANGLAMVFPDNSAGHIGASLIGYPYKAMGCQPQIIYFPADQRDLSSLGTKIKSINPAWLSVTPQMGSETMALVFGSCYDAGYRGKMFSFLTSDVGLLQPVFKPEILEGYICAMSAMEYGDFNGTMTQLASDMKQAYVAKNGKWDYADYMTVPSLYVLLAGIQKAGSIDTDAVAAALHSGINGIAVPDGTLNMIQRPDMNTSGNYIDGVMDNSLKQIKSNKAVLIAHFGPEECLRYERMGYPSLQPGQTPSIVAAQ
jgi:ABC-type branched-subunit amino acid transport system substrate-binding protein